MDLTPENKAHIDAMDYEALLRQWRFAPVGDRWFMGETGKYWSDRMLKLRNQNPAAAVAASKSIGWE